MQAATLISCYGKSHTHGQYIRKQVLTEEDNEPKQVRLRVHLIKYKPSALPRGQARSVTAALTVKLGDDCLMTPSVSDTV